MALLVVHLQLHSFQCFKERIEETHAILSGVQVGVSLAIRPSRDPLVSKGIERSDRSLTHRARELISDRFDGTIEERGEEQTPDYRLFSSLSIVLDRHTFLHRALLRGNSHGPVSAEPEALAIWISVWIRR